MAPIRSAVGERTYSSLGVPRARATRARESPLGEKSLVSLSPVPSQQPEAATCANCSALLALDQRYCLACGHPVSPVRLSFLDVLSADAQAQPYVGAQPMVSLAPGYAPVIEPVPGPYAWLRRYSGLFGLLSVLLLAILAGLLIGHWVTQGNAPSRQVVKVEGLGNLAAAAPSGSAGTATTAPATAAPAGAAKSAGSSSSGKETTKEAAKTEAHEVQEAKAIEKKPPPKAVKVSSEKLKKLGSTSGQKHEQEIDKLGAQPIETGG
jgi:hypothetical protein